MNLNPISLVSSLWQTATSSPSNTVARLTNSAKNLDNSSISTPAELFGELQQLSQSNSAQFKSVTAQIAQQLQAAAGKATDSTQANQLKQMATNFQNASQSGKFSDLFANSGNGTTASGNHAGHHHHHASGQSTTSSDSDP